jgi:hypothetical protein
MELRMSNLLTFICYKKIISRSKYCGKIVAIGNETHEIMSNNDSLNYLNDESFQKQVQTFDKITIIYKTIQELRMKHILMICC